MRVDPCPLVAVAHFHAAQDPCKTLGFSLLHDSCGLQQEDKGAGTAIHDRHFGSGEIHRRVVDAKAGEGRHQVFDGGNTHLALLQHRAHAGVAHLHGKRGNANRRSKIGAAEHDARAGRRRMHFHRDLRAAVQTHTRSADAVLEGALTEHRGDGRLR